MYETVANIRVKAGHGDELFAVMEKWEHERGHEVKGNLGGYLFRLDRDPQEMILVAVFEDKESYEANADNPEQDKWYQEMRQHLEADPQWNDGEAFSM